MISLIWAMDENRLIGRQNALPWQLPADMQWFRKNTMGKPILMGRKTFESIGRPLPGRTNIVLSRQQGLAIDGCTVVSSLDEAKQVVPQAEEIMVIGGAEIYAALLPRADRLYVTKIHAAFDGDAWFPEFDMAHWRESFREAHAPDDNNACAYDFVILERV